MGVINEDSDPLGKMRKTSKDAMKAAESFAEAANKAADNATSSIKGFANSAANGIAKVASSAIDMADAKIERAKEPKKKREKNFASLESLQPVVNVVNDAAMALSDKNRTIKESSIPEVVAGALGAGVGGVGSFMALYGLGTVGLSAAGITSGLAAAGSIVGGGMAAGIFVLAAPVALAAGAGVALASHLKNKQLSQEKERLYKEALAKHQAIIKALKDESDASAERLEYLQSLNILLERAVNDLKSDLALQDE